MFHTGWTFRVTLVGRYSPFHTVSGHFDVWETLFRRFIHVSRHSDVWELCLGDLYMFHTIWTFGQPRLGDIHCFTPFHAIFTYGEPCLGDLYVSHYLDV